MRMKKHMFWVVVNIGNAGCNRGPAARLRSQIPTTTGARRAHALRARISVLLSLRGSAAGQLNTKKSTVENDVLLKRKSRPQKGEADPPSPATARLAASRAGYR
jgi:hypothetical protein